MNYPLCHTSLVFRRAKSAYLRVLPRWARITVPIVVALVVLAVVAAWALTVQALPAGAPPNSDYLAAAGLTPLPRVEVAATGSTGSWTAHCGRNENGHRNADNVITSFGRVGAAGHLHDYVGNVATSADTTDAQLERAATTCADGDRSTYFWTVLRVFGKGSGPASAPVGMNTGRVLRPDTVLIQFHGNPVSSVLPMPYRLRASSGNAKAVTEAGAYAEHVNWGCSGEPGRGTRLYPRCPAGQKLVRTFDFPSCWDGRRTDSPNHRDQVMFPAAGGACPADTFAVPELRITLTYAVPHHLHFAIDTMMDQHRSPLTDHADFIDFMPDALMQQVVSCINAGRRC